MTDELIFPIGFDLESGIKATEGEADNLLRQLEHRMNRYPLQVKVEMDGSKFAMFSRQFSNNIDGISNKIAQANRLWNEMRFDVKFDADGNLTRRAQVVFDAFEQLIGASETMGQRLSQVNRQLQQSEAETTRLITAEYDKKQRLINEQIRDKERQAVAEERVRQSQLKGVNVGYVDLQKQTEAVCNLRLQYEAILPMLNAMAQKRVDIKIGIDKQFEADVNRINAEIARLRQSNLQLGAKGDTNAIQANLTAIRQLEAELQRISQQKIDLLNTNKINEDLARLRSEISSVFGELQSAEYKLASDNSLNAALDAQSQKVLNLHSQIQKLDQQIAQLNAQGKMYNADGSFSTQATAILQQRIALTKELEQAAVTGQQAQIKLEQQLREEKRQTEREAKQAAKEAEQQAKAEAATRKQAIESANAENKTRQSAYNSRRKQGLETQRILQKEAKSIADITAQLQIQQQRLNSANVGSAKFNKIAEEVKRLISELDEANQKMRELTGQTVSGANKQASSVSRVSQEFKKQDTYVSRLIKRLAVYASFSAIGNFLTNVREVTAQFELQRVSLGAIIQDQTKANAIFSEIKQFALKSPISILDLTKYTKQVAAYRVSADELFDTTKRLADVSVGLGVSMDRIVLAYGQVKAASYLRAAEVRQFTEAGIPMLELVAEKLSKMNGEMVTTEQAMEIISERGVGFEVVKEIFDDLTSAGGMFYNMQEKQGNTLYGMWAKLGDAASVMYEQIGNSDIAQWAMRGMIQALTDLMRNWREVSRYIGVAGIALTSYMLTSKLGTVSTIMAAKATRDYARAQVQLNIAKNEGSKMSIIAASASARAAAANRVAATTTNVWTVAKYRLIAAANSLKAALATNWITLAITAILALANALYSAWENAHRLDNTLNDIKSETSTLQVQSVRNFEYLAKSAVQAANGSKEQKTALDELNRTYGDILPKESLKIENLKAMKGHYESLTQVIKENIAAQQQEKAINSINEEYGAKITKTEKAIRESLKTALNMSDVDIDRFFAQFKSLSTDASLTLEQKVTKAFENIGRKLTAFERDNLFRTFFGGVKTTDLEMLENLSEAVMEMESRVKAVRDEYQKLTAGLGEFDNVASRVENKLNATRFVMPDGQNIDSSQHSYMEAQLRANAWIKHVADAIQNDKSIVSAFNQMGVKINEGWFSIIEKLDPNNLTAISQVNFDAILEQIDNFLNNTNNTDAALKARITSLRGLIIQWQEQYKNMAPTEATIKVVNTRWEKINHEFKTSEAFMNKMLMKAGQDLKQYREVLEAELKNIQVRMKALASLLKMTANSKLNLLDDKQKKEWQSQLDEMSKDAKAIKKMLANIPTFEAKKTKRKGSGRAKSGRSEEDNRIATLNKLEQALTEVNNAQKELSKTMGNDAASKKVKELYANVLKDVNRLGKQFNLAFDYPLDFNKLQNYRKEILKVMKSINTKKDKDNPALTLEVKIGKEDNKHLQEQIEAKLKELASQISHTKAAKEFYNTILSETGDIVLAANLTIDLYGETGSALQKELADQIRTYFNNSSVKIDIPLDVITTDNQINYRKLGELVEKYKTELGEKPYEALKKIAQEGQKDLANLTKGYFKDLKSAEDYADKREKLALDTAEKIRQINENTNYSDDKKEKLIAGYRNKEMKEAAKLEWEAFQDTPLYVQMFDDLEKASTTSLKMMKSRIEELSQTWGSMFDPTQLKEMQSRANEISEQLRERNPWKSLKESWKEYQDAVNSVTLPNATSEVGKASTQYYNDVRDYGADSEVAKKTKEILDTKEKIADIVRTITSEEGGQLKGMKALNEASKIAFDNLKIARGQVGIYSDELNDAIAAAKKKNPTDYERDPSVIAAQENLENAKRTFRISKAIADYFQITVKQSSNLKEGIIAAAKDVTDWLNAGEAAARAIADLSAEFGVDENDVQYFNDIADGLGNISAGLQDIIQNGLQGNIAGILTSVLSAIPKMVIGFSQIFNASRIKKANKEIKRQQELLDQLEYTMSRLENSAEKLFGADYITNLKEQRSALEAQAEAYQKQIEAEKSKGKKANKDELKQMEEDYRDVLDQLDDLQKASEQMLGSTLESKARDAAKAWIEAYKEMGAAGANTTQAMKEQFQDMIENMVVEGAMAAVMQKALEPMFKMINNMDEADFQNESFWKNVVSEANKGAELADEGAQILMNYLEKAGIQLKDISDEATGISRDTSSATSEEINANTSALNTQNFYIAQIHSNVAQILAGMGNESANIPAIDYTDLVQQSVDRLSMIERYSSEILVECRRNAIAAENALTEIQRVIAPRGSVATHQVSVAM